MSRPAPAWLAAALLLGGCVPGIEREAPAPGSAADRQVERCVALLNKARGACRERLGTDGNPGRFECMSARAKLREECY